MASGMSATIALYALRQNISLYYTPSQLMHVTHTNNKLIRIGGIVVKNSVHYFSNSTQVQFAVSDSHHSIKVDYNGILPALFRVGQTVVVQGYLKQGQFFADQVLAKHGANYHGN